MAAVGFASTSVQRPLLTLCAMFVLWKAVILLIGFSSPGHGYDTSTTLLDGFESSRALPNFVRWDAIYFTQIAQHGHVYEQEWAFGIGISTALSYSARVLFWTNSPSLSQITLSGILISHISGCISVVLVWHIARRLITADERTRSSICFVAALLYIISPAGIFLSAPYTESLFAALNMSAYLLFFEGRSCFKQQRYIHGTTFTVGSGIAAALGTIVRSNGILSGILFAWDASLSLVAMCNGDASLSRFLRLLSLGLAGLVTGLGAVLPQYLGYLEYCSTDAHGVVRPWCTNTIPSIFTFVQSHYWDVGLFRYWTISNTPLFVLAAPALYILVVSAVTQFRRIWSESASTTKLSSESAYLATPQLILALLAIIYYHVQIITRISSGYPFWYIWLASEHHTQAVNMKAIVKWMALYGLIQAGLYASFLPPA